LYNYKFGHITPWWDDSFKDLDYQYIPIMNIHDQERWATEGYTSVRLNGATYNMRRLEENMPEYTKPFLTMFDWENIGLSYYRQNTLDMFPLHQDFYTTYKKIWNISDNNKIWRCIVFLEDWKSGHYFEIDGVAHLNWRKGDYVVWQYDTPHAAANIGTEPRYTMQITGTQR
jgi:hypothetical protein